MIIITTLPQGKYPEPGPSDCEPLIQHTNALITALKKTQNQLNAISSDPDEALLTIRNQVTQMLAEAEKMKKKLNAINAEAVRMADATSFKNNYI